MKKKVFLLFILLNSAFSFAQKYSYGFELSDIAERIIPMLSVNRYYHESGWIWKEGRSSALVEKGKLADFYEINKIDDMDMDIGEDNTSTAWIEGSEGDGIGEWVIIPVEAYEGYGSDGGFARKLARGETSGKMNVFLHICNGYQESLSSYYDNNRIKEAKISIYVAAYDIGYDQALLLWNPDCIFEKTITLNDEVIRNPICLNYHSESFAVTLPEKYRQERCELYMKLEICSVYKGKNFARTCISQMGATVDE